MAMVIRTTALTAAFIPGASPPEVMTAIRFLRPPPGVSGLLTAGVIPIGVFNMLFRISGADNPPVVAVVNGFVFLVNPTSVPIGSWV